LQTIEHERDMVEIVVERVQKLRRRRREQIARGQPALHQMRELAEPHCAGHARAALERV